MFPPVVARIAPESAAFDEEMNACLDVGPSRIVILALIVYTLLRIVFLWYVSFEQHS